MEVEAKKSKAKRNRKRKKLNPSNESLKTVIKPENFDGMTNWLKLQKVLAVENKSKEPSSSNSRPYHNFSKKKHQGKKDSNKNKWSSNDNLPKASYKFDFSERKSSIMASQKDISDRLSDNEASDSETKQSTKLTKALAMDCEMVGTGPDGADSMLARVSIVNSFGDTVYDTFVAPKVKVTDYRTAVSGVRPSDLKNGKDLFEVQKEVTEIIEGRRIVGHDLKHDFEALFLSHPKSLIRDTSRYRPFRDLSGGRTPSLRKLVALVLGCNIQSGEHNSVEDAQAAMLLYLKHKHAWEKSLRRKRKNMQQPKSIPENS